MADLNFDGIIAKLQEIHAAHPDLDFGMVIQTAIDRHSKKKNTDLHQLTSKEIKSALNGFFAVCASEKGKTKELRVAQEIRVKQ